MVDLTSRQRELLSALCRRRTYITTKELSDVVGVSVRTARSDLRVIAAFVQSIDAVLERSAGRGIRLSCDAAAREEIASLVSSATLQSVLSIQECSIVAEVLLLMHQTVTFQELSDNEKAAVKIAAEVGRVNTAMLFERAGIPKRSAVRVLRGLSERGVLIWHGTSKTDPSQYYDFGVEV